MGGGDDFTCNISLAVGRLVDNHRGLMGGGGGGVQYAGVRVLCDTLKREKLNRREHRHGSNCKENWAWFFPSLQNCVFVYPLCLFGPRVITYL